MLYYGVLPNFLTKPHHPGLGSDEDLCYGELVIMVKISLILHFLPQATAVMSTLGVNGLQQSHTKEPYNAVPVLLTMRSHQNKPTQNTTNTETLPNA